MSVNVQELHGACQAHCAESAIEPASHWRQHALIMSDQPRQQIFLKEWRKHRLLSQERLAERMEVDRTVISKVENGKIGYTQGFMEAAAYALQCTPADLLMRDPTQPGAIWSIWEGIPETERPRALQVLSAFMAANDQNRKTG